MCSSKEQEIEWVWQAWQPTSCALALAGCVSCCAAPWLQGGCSDQVDRLVDAVRTVLWSGSLFVQLVGVCSGFAVSLFYHPVCRCGRPGSIALVHDASLSTHHIHFLLATGLMYNSTTPQRPAHLPLPAPLPHPQPKHSRPSSRRRRVFRGLNKQLPSLQAQHSLPSPLPPPLPSHSGHNIL